MWQTLLTPTAQVILGSLIPSSQGQGPKDPGGRVWLLERTGPNQMLPEVDSGHVHTRTADVHSQGPGPGLGGRGKSLDKESSGLTLGPSQLRQVD